MAESITGKTRQQMRDDLTVHFAACKPEDCGCTVCLIRLIIEDEMVRKLP